MTTEGADADTAGERLAKRVAAQAGCSRSEAERYIAGGFVTVDGRVVEEPAFRVRGETVRLAPGATLAPQPAVTLLLHKPAGATVDAVLPTLAQRWSGDRSGIAPLSRHFARLHEHLPVPAEASGLVVLTQDGRIARRLDEDAALIEQECIVEVSGDAGPDALARLCHGLVLAGRALPPIKVSWQSEHRLRFALRDIRPDEVPAMCRAVGLRVQALRRIRIGRVPLAALPVGQWRYLAAHEHF